MFKLSIMGMVLVALSIVLCLLALLLSKKSFADREKSSAFECGFEPFSSSRLPFSLRFYLIALIFLIFDVEIVLILPMVNLFNFVDTSVWFTVGTLFTLILLIGLYFEWHQGALSWK